MTISLGPCVGIMTAVTAFHVFSVIYTGNTLDSTWKKVSMAIVGKRAD